MTSFYDSNHHKLTDCCGASAASKRRGLGCCFKGVTDELMTYYFHMEIIFLQVKISSYVLICETSALSQ